MAETVTEIIGRHRLIVIGRSIPAEKAVPVAEALYEGGIRLLEITFDQSSATRQRETCEMIRRLDRHFGGDMCVGAGTVMNNRQAEAAADAGAHYIISPVVDGGVIGYTKKRGLVSIPGALTPTEAARAYQAGADFVKLFPAGELGTGYIRAVRGPLSHIPILAVGGIDENNVAEFFRAGVSGVGVGANILKKEFVSGGNYSGIRDLAKKYLDAINAG